MKDLDGIKTIEELKEIYSEKLPNHIGLILDGNRRWIRKQGLIDTMKGHLAGYETLKNILEPMLKANILYLSVYALSSENLSKRKPGEIKYLFNLLLKGVNEILKEPSIYEHEIRVSILGRIKELPKKIQEGIYRVNKTTEKHNKRFVNICINYDGHLEIVDAVKSIIQNNIPIEQIDKTMIKTHLYTKRSPELDYIIRTGMDDGARISGFLLWDASYAEFRFREELWPDYNEELLLEDLKIYIKRNRRKGA